MKQHIYQNHKGETLGGDKFIVSLNEADRREALPGIINVKMTRMSFPGGERHIKIETPIPKEATILIEAAINSSADMMDLLLINDALRRLDVGKRSLYLPSLPGARQDRVCVKGEPLSAHVYAQLINSCEFDGVLCVTPHSDVMPALINKLQIVENFDAYQISEHYIKHIPKNGTVNIIIPDAGAAKRTREIAKSCTTKRPDVTVNLVQAEKDRCLETGKILNFSVQSEDLEGQPTIIIDDINCNGGTFIGLAGKLRERKCGELTLYTTHTDHVRGIHNVSQHFNKVITCNTNGHLDSGFMPERVTIIPIFQ